LNFVIEKIVHSTKKFIFELEYFSENLIKVTCGDQNNAYWKQNFPKLYLSKFPNLKTIKIPYCTNNLVDVAFLFEK